MDEGPVSNFVVCFLHFDKHLNYVIGSFGIWSYAISLQLSLPRLKPLGLLRGALADLAGILNLCW
jgi:hypothetical protein